MMEGYTIITRNMIHLMDGKKVAAKIYRQRNGQHSVFMPLHGFGWVSPSQQAAKDSIDSFLSTPNQNQ